MRHLLFMLVVWCFSLPAMAIEGLSGSGHSAHGNSTYTIVMLVIFVAIFYFMLIRPQMKRTKQQRQLLASIKVGDEVVTISGMMGKITHLDGETVSLAIAKAVVIKVQKQSISSILPVGTLDSEVSD